jgi:molybdopterin converting factor small subunit
MPVEVRVPSMLQRLTGGRRVLHCNAPTVRALLDCVERDHPGFRAQLVDDGEVRRFVNLFLNDEDIRFLQQLDTPLQDGDVLSILPALAGGTAGG